MTRIITVSAAAVMLAVSPFAIAPASAASVNVHVNGGNYGHGYYHQRHRKVVEKRVIRHDHCSSKTVITQRHGQRIVKKIRTCG